LSSKTSPENYSLGLEDEDIIGPTLPQVAVYDASDGIWYSHALYYLLNQQQHINTPNS